MNIFIPDSIKKRLEAHAKAHEPNESCAILFGKEDAVTEIYLAENIDYSPTQFTISNKELLDAYEFARESGTEMVGIFHSHPNSEAYPSSTDKRYMLTNPVTWVIYSGVQCDFKAFILGSEIKEITIIWQE